MTNEEKAKEIARINQEYYDSSSCRCLSSEEECYDSAMEMAEWKDEQPILELGGWHTEEPTEEGWYLVDTPDFPKNCSCVVAEWYNDANSFFTEASYPIDFHKWKLIERR